MPTLQTLECGPLAQLEQPDAIVRQRMLQLQLSFNTLRTRQDADDLPVDLKAVDQVRNVRKVEGRSVLTADIQPDQASRANCTAEDLDKVQRVDVGESGADEGKRRFEVRGTERGSKVLWRGNVNIGRVDGGRIDGCLKAVHRCDGWYVLDWDSHICQIERGTFDMHLKTKMYDYPVAFLIRGIPRLKLAGDYIYATNVIYYNKKRGNLLVKEVH